VGIKFPFLNIADIGQLKRGVMGEDFNNRSGTKREKFYEKKTNRQNEMEWD